MIVMEKSNASLEKLDSFYNTQTDIIFIVFSNAMEFVFTLVLVAGELSLIEGFHRMSQS